ncbi:MAG: inositol-1-monophosphatase [Gammaproteobacteria bacterium]|nr:inositol-1-monophosphatase [Pseudomonadota bacterium]PCH61959.1 MAG: inositol-1-monophosphatase [Gammaproteobacteria bacterium]
MHPLLNIAIRAARSAGNVIIRSIQHVEHLDVTTKGRNDFVSDVDRLAEREIINAITKAYPDHAIMAEESGNSGDSDTVWIIDPLDGTTNFLHGFPHYCVSIAVMVRGKIEHGVVYDPLREELFTASRGDGAQLNDRRLRVAKRKELANSLLATGFPFKNPQHLPAFLATFTSLFNQVADVRRTGSAALDLAYVAAGRLDGYWEIGLEKWDLAAGALLIEEAGGVISDFVGGDNYINSGNVVVGNLHVQKQMLDGITPHLTDELKK